MKKTNIFIYPKSNVGDTEDYKQVFTDIISDRIKKDIGKKKQEQIFANVLKNY